MGKPTLQAQVDAANAYEALFVPALFGQWAPKVADAAQIQPRQRVLDVACGTGILAREIAARIGSGKRIVGVDPSPEWLQWRNSSSVQVTTHLGTAQFPSIRAMVEADLRGWLPVMGVILSEDRIDRILQEARQALSSCATSDGAVKFHLSAHIVTAKKP
jgi:SAM-dependent methyltransferase